MNRNGTSGGRQASAGMGAADPNPWAFTLDEMGYDNTSAGIGKNHIRNAHMITDRPVITMSSKELRSPIRIEVKSAAEAAQREKMSSISGNVIEETIKYVFAANCCAATKGKKNSFT